VEKKESSVVVQLGMSLTIWTSATTKACTVAMDEEGLHYESANDRHPTRSPYAARRR
jgi:DNA-binding IclR family transcriptional regulator